MPGRAITLLFAFLLTTPVFADRGERSLGLELGGGYPPGGRASLCVQEGLSDWVAARVDAGLHLSEIRESIAPEALVAFGFVVAFDVFAWVPELSLGAGGAFGEHGIRGRIIAKAGVRFYLAMDWSLGFSVAGEWTPVDDWLLLGNAGLWWHFDDGL